MILAYMYVHYNNYVGSIKYSRIHAGWPNKDLYIIHN